MSPDNQLLFSGENDIEWKAILYKMSVGSYLVVWCSYLQYNVICDPAMSKESIRVYTI